MTTTYIVTQGEGERKRNIAVFTDRETAEACRDANPGSQIEEHQPDAWKKEPTPPKYTTIYPLTESDLKTLAGVACMAFSFGMLTTISGDKVDPEHVRADKARVEKAVIDLAGELVARREGQRS